MYYIEPIQDVLKRQYLINALTTNCFCIKMDNIILYNLMNIKPLADLCEQLAISIEKLKKQSQ